MKIYKCTKSNKMVYTLIDADCTPECAVDRKSVV